MTYNEMRSHTQYCIFSTIERNLQQLTDRLKRLQVWRGGMEGWDDDEWEEEGRVFSNHRKEMRTDLEPAASCSELVRISHR